MASTTEIIKILLQEHECQYEEAVISQLNEYAFKYMKTIIQTSQDVAESFDRSSITLDDLKFAMEISNNNELSINHKELFALQKNKQKILDIDQTLVKNNGIKFPVKDTNMIQKPNYQLIVQQQQPPQKANPVKIEFDNNHMKEEVVQQKIKIEIPDMNHDF